MILPQSSSGFLRVGFKRVHAFQMWSYLGVILALFQLIMIQALWRGVYSDADTNLGVPIHITMSYLSVIAISNFVIRTSVADELHRRIDEGTVAVDLIRPTSLSRQLILLSVGDSVGRWALLIIVVPAVWIVGTLYLPSISAFGLFLLSLALAYVVNLLIWMLVGISAFYTIGGTGMRSLVGLMSGLLSGAFIPLWFMPGWLEATATVLPFRAIAHVPGGVFVGQITGAELVKSLGVQVLWIGLLAFTYTSLWKFVQKRIAIQGG